MRRFVFSSSAFFGEVGGVVKLFERVLQFPEEDDRFGENDVEYPDEDGEERSDFCFRLFFKALELSFELFDVLDGFELRAVGEHLGGFGFVQSPLDDAESEKTVDEYDGDEHDDQEAYERPHVTPEEDVKDEEDGFEVPSHDFSDGAADFFGRDFARDTNRDEKPEKVAVRGALFRLRVAKLHHQFLERVWFALSFLFRLFFHLFLLRERRFFVRARTFLR